MIVFSGYLGATDPATAPNAPLSVKSYSTSKGVVWASYQSPITNEVLKSVQRRANGFGFSAPLPVDGVIGQSTVSAVQTIAQRYWTVDPRANSLAAVSKTPEQLAKSGRTVANLLDQLLNQYIGTWDPRTETSTSAPKPPTTSGGGVLSPPTWNPPTTVPSSNGSTLPPLPDVTATLPAAGWPTWTYYVAGGMLALGIGFFVWSYVKVGKGEKPLKGLDGLVRGDKLPRHLREQVLRKYIYRWTYDNPRREEAWRGVRGQPTVPLISDEQWLRERGFEVTKNGTLSKRQKWAEPHYGSLDD